MEIAGRGSSPASLCEEDMDLRRGPWTMEEDLILVNYIANHGEGRWNALARSAGLKRTGKSCRLRWLNYLRPDVRRGNITPEEQLLILELHSRWGNRWSKIAQHLPGRTDNEIKNYWRTRVQKQAKQLQCDVNSKQFKDTMRYLWMPRLIERIQAANSASATAGKLNCQPGVAAGDHQVAAPVYDNMAASSHRNPSCTSENSSTAASSDSAGPTAQVVSPGSDFKDFYFQGAADLSGCGFESGQSFCPESLPGSVGLYNTGLDFGRSDWFGGDVSDCSWNGEDMWFWQQQLSNGV